MLKNEDNKNFRWYVCVKFFQRIIFKACIQFRILYAYIRKSFFVNLLDPKRMKVVSLKLQYQKILSDSLKIRT